MFVDLSFPARGNELATEHQYLLFGALSNEVQAFHQPEGPRFAAINGEKGGRGRIRLFERSRLRVRVPAERITDVLPLAGRTLRVGGDAVHLGAPTVTPLIPAPTLAALIVTFKHADEPERFLCVARRKLDENDIAGEPGIPLVQQGGRAGEPRRRIVRVKGCQLVGYALQVAGLTADESLRLQEIGLGGKVRMGCGFFVPDQSRVS